MWQETRRQKERETRHWYQHFSCTYIHELTFSNNHKHAHSQTHKKNVCVFVRARPCLCYCLKGEQSPSSSVYWYLDQTFAYRLDKHQSKWLCSVVDLPTTSRPLQDRCTRPPRQSQYLWIKHDTSRLRLPKRSRTCDVEDVRAFALRRANFLSLLRRASPRTSLEVVNQEKLYGPKSPVPQRQCATWHVWMHD